MKLLLIRHAESNGNAAGGDYSVEDADALSPKGLAQAEKLGACLESWDIDKIIVSPLQRALQTIAPYLVRTGRTGEVWPELTEACWHDEREPPAETWECTPTTLPHDIAPHFYFRDGRAVHPAHPQTFGHGLRRVHDALEKLEQRFGGTEETILLTSHAHFLRELINAMLARSTPEDIHHDNTGMTLMRFDTEWKMEFCNQNGSHQ